MQDNWVISLHTRSERLSVMHKLEKMSKILDYTLPPQNWVRAEVGSNLEFVGDFRPELT